MPGRVAHGKGGALLGDLLAGLDEGEVRRVAIGFNWTLVEGEDGCGLAQTPSRGMAGCHPLADAGLLAGRPLAEVAALVESENPVEVAVGMAAINAFYNRRDLEGSPDNGLDAFSDIEGPVTVVGRFPGLEKRIKILRVIEREPREGEYPESAAAELLPESDGVIITASALTNFSLGGLLDLAASAEIALVGPGTPLAKQLFAHGVDVLAGSVVEDVDGALRVVIEGGAVTALRPHIRYVTLFRSDAKRARSHRA